MYIFNKIHVLLSAATYIGRNQYRHYVWPVRESVKIYINHIFCCTTKKVHTVLVRSIVLIYFRSACILRNHKCISRSGI